MVLVDTSVWVDHLRRGTVGLDLPLSEGQVLCHLFIIGELACGNLKNRPEILSLLRTLPAVRSAEEDEALQFIERHRLMGKGLGYIAMRICLRRLFCRICPSGRLINGSAMPQHHSASGMPS